MFIITGGSSGIGKALALTLAKRGKKVLIIGRREALLQKIAAEFPTISYCTADISSPTDRETIYSFIEKEPSISALINNAGIIEPILAPQDISLADWQQVMATNVEAPFFLTQKIFPKLHQGRVLNISSGLAHFPAIGLSAYCISKASLDMLTRCWQLESQDVAFARVMPGIVDTHMQDGLRTNDAIDQKNHQFYNDLQQKQQLISPATVASFLSWLLLDLSANEFSAQEWDIYDKKHHAAWLKTPDEVPTWSE